ncbi:ImmA/IrrE family metallo-endopeptidase [Agathobaculum sp. NTUH-O15-33]|uniref:ImmA/IrrE family metallo-endopeptidase n=1 Tax=Agathobaculum sp. NTUH-O15-33 TaxID=3079302 RepID=UPI002958D8C4|nr:ImmA/IrrE family metallo-endopeptidase [Agathobaculum sp. NTUH-O15-33]WNX85726.1 ImmA/IrrE family metallo-endopeptidase [Agathobaculum sp. NTUH-O15-33]
MKYRIYQESRNAAWDLLIKEQVRTLPVQVGAICRHMGFAVFSYAVGKNLIAYYGLANHARRTDGFTVRAGDDITIFYDQTKPDGRNRFTIAHELGHIVLGHLGNRQVTAINREQAPGDDPRETAANIFAARLLAPSCVLWGMHVQTAEEIANVCHISHHAAEIRAKRMQLLYAREHQFLQTRGKSCFLQHPKERRVYEQFRAYIEHYKSG